MATPLIRGLYVIVDPDACGGREAVEVARLALEGGASVLQWRDKARQGGREKGDQLPEVRAVRELCRAHQATFIVNDHADLALAAGADGVHLGPHDLPVEAVRQLAPPEFVIGVSTNDVDEALRAQAAGASYVAVGSIFPTASKEPERTRAASPERLREVRAALRPSTGSGRAVPVVAIGGINASNVDQVLAAGADAVAVIGAVCGADDPRAAAQELARRFRARA